MLAPIESILLGTILSATSVLYASLGEVLGQRAGIVNLGLEGIMLMGAVTGFAATVHFGSAALGTALAMAAGASFNMVFAYLVIGRRANQLASGLASMFLGIGLSALIGAPYIGSQIGGLRDLPVPGLTRLPLLGRALFTQDILVYLVVPLALLLWWVLSRTRWGLHVRAVGEDPVAAFAAGVNPHAVQYQALLLAGVLGGLAGAHLALGVGKTWAQFMTAGRGFIAVALVIFARWHPLRAVVGALVFGGAVALQIQMQVRGVPISPFLLDTIPYLLSIAVLVLWSGARRAAPASLGRMFGGTE